MYHSFVEKSHDGGKKCQQQEALGFVSSWSVFWHKLPISLQASNSGVGTGSWPGGTL